MSRPSLLDQADDIMLRWLLGYAWRKDRFCGCAGCTQVAIQLLARTMLLQAHLDRVQAAAQARAS